MRVLSTGSGEQNYQKVCRGLHFIVPPVMSSVNVSSISSVIILQPKVGRKTASKNRTRQHIHHYKFSDVRRISIEPATTAYRAGGAPTTVCWCWDISRGWSTSTTCNIAQTYWILNDISSSRCCRCWFFSEKLCKRILNLCCVLCRENIGAAADNLRRENDGNHDLV